MVVGNVPRQNYSLLIWNIQYAVMNAVDAVVALLGCMQYYCLSYDHCNVLHCLVKTRSRDARHTN